MKKNFDEIDRNGFPGFYKKNLVNLKRHFDEIDASGFRDFSKRNFDEIDASGFRGFDKKNLHESDWNDFGKRNFDEIDASGFRGFDKKNSVYEKSGFHDFGGRNLQNYNRLRFPSLRRLVPKNLKRNNYLIDDMKKKNFDEIDRVGFPGFSNWFSFFIFVAEMLQFFTNKLKIILLSKNEL